MDNMKKYAFYMPKSLIDDVDNTINSLGKMSRAEFIREAVDFYIGYLNSLRASDYLSPMLSRAIKSEIESVEKNVSEMIFKLAVQSAVTNIFIASELNLDTSNIDYLTKCAAKEIAKQNGIIDLKKASEMFRTE
ncbi:ribbon-helix-helix domain-containing protein [uncultured Eubacterium sp.]|uniref:ribbon-helix-helix domain-containing protein n=1 Tax=uncultured Eubacterium sp. TaxID=165185 RepID=UPI0025E1B3A4|nr:ribbon-helix-helix domain-containing protein [uncultured Eubacterium sp.]